MPASPKPPERRRAPPQANTNALKHGFYSRQLNRLDLADLEACQFSGLTDEINLMRVFIRRLIEKGNQAESFSDTLTFVRALSLANTSLDRMLNTHAKISSPENDYASNLTQALEALYEKGFIQDPTSPSNPAEE